MNRQKILVARAVFPDVVSRLREHFVVEDNPGDHIHSKSELIDRLQGKDGAFTAGSDRIDAEVLAACPQLRVVCNMAVGYNNFDIAACTAAGVLATNTPDVLTETTADFGFALMMAAARRIAESEHFLRRGELHGDAVLEVPYHSCPHAAEGHRGAHGGADGELDGGARQRNIDDLAIVAPAVIEHDGREQSGV